MSRARLAADSRLHAIVSLSAVGVLGATVVSPTFPGMAAAFEITESRVALVMTAFFLPAAVTIPVVGSLADAWGRRPILLGSLLVYGVAGVGIGVADSFAAVLALRVVQGCAFPGLIPISIAVIGDLYDGAEATRAQGFRTSLNGLTGILAPAIAGVAAGLSWRAPYAMYALAVPVLALCYVTLPESRTAAGGGEDGSLLSVDRARIVAAARDVWAALTRPVLAVIAATILLFLVRYALLTFVPLYVVNGLGSSEAVGGYAVALASLGRFAVAPTAGRLVIRFGRRATLLASLGLFVVGTWLLAVVPTPVAVLFAVGVASVGEGAFNPVANDFVTASTPTAVRARVVSVLEVGKTGAIAAAPVLFGVVLATSSFQALFLVGGAVAVGAAIVVSGHGGGIDAAVTAGKPGE